MGFLRIMRFAFVPAPFGIHASSRLNSPSRRIYTVKVHAAQQTGWGPKIKTTAKRKKQQRFVVSRGFVGEISAA
jgi:SOS response regulatory protein OraA/RecX